MGDVSANPKSAAQYAHLSTISPEFAPLKDFVDGRLKLNSPFEKPINDFRAGVAAAGKNMPLPEGCPEIGKDIITADSEVEVRDGAKIGIRTYRSKNFQPKNALLYFKTHGGGKNFSLLEI
jgi:predicted acyl esterase